MRGAPMAPRLCAHGSHSLRLRQYQTVDIRLAQKSAADPNVERTPPCPTIFIASNAWSHEHCFIVEPLGFWVRTAFEYDTQKPIAHSQVAFEATDSAVKVRSQRPAEDGRVLNRVTEAVLPTLRLSVPNPRVAQFARVESIGWVLPIDETSFRIYVAGRVRQARDIGRMRSEIRVQVLVGPDRSRALRHVGR